MPRTCTIVLVSALIVVSGAAARTPPGQVISIPMGPPGQPPAPSGADGTAPRATATVRGHVVAGDTGQPLRKAQVRISSMDGGPGSSRENRLATTDADGRYEFANLAAGAYLISA